MPKPIGHRTITKPIRNSLSALQFCSINEWKLRIATVCTFDESFHSFKWNMNLNEWFCLTSEYSHPNYSPKFMREQASLKKAINGLRRSYKFVSIYIYIYLKPQHTHQFRHFVIVLIVCVCFRSPCRRFAIRRTKSLHEINAIHTRNCAFQPHETDELMVDWTFQGQSVAVAYVLSSLRTNVAGYIVLAGEVWVQVPGYARKRQITNKFYKELNLARQFSISVNQFNGSTARRKKK